MPRRALPGGAGAASAGVGARAVPSGGVIARAREKCRRGLEQGVTVAAGPMSLGAGGRHMQGYPALDAASLGSLGEEGGRGGGLGSGIFSRYWESF